MNRLFATLICCALLVTIATLFLTTANQVHDQSVVKFLASNTSEFQASLLNDNVLSHNEYRLATTQLMDCVGKFGVTSRDELQIDQSSGRFELYLVYPSGDKEATRAEIDHCFGEYYSEVMKAWDWQLRVGSLANIGLRDTPGGR